MNEAVLAAVRRARAAQAEVASWPQERIDEVVVAVGWHCYREDNVHRLAKLAHDETALGDPEHLYGLQRRRVLGTLRDLHGARTVGVVEDLPELGIRRIAKPLGVIAVASPATAPGPGIICNALPMLKTRNAAIFSPNPRARRTAMATVEVMRAALRAAGAPEDLVQCLENPGRQEISDLMSACDYVVAIGGAGTVRRAYESGTPAIGAGVGNPTAIVDETADIVDAAEHIHTGAGYNNGTSCSSESNVLVEESVAEQFRAELVRRGAYLCDAAETDRLRRLMWPDGDTLSRVHIGQPAQVLAKAVGIELDQPDKTTVLVLTCGDPARDSPILREKIAPLLTMATYKGFDHAMRLVQKLADQCGRGHSCAVHTSDPDRVDRLAEYVTTARVVVNQSTMTNTGSFESGVPFTTTLSSGSWGGCSVSGNVTWRHFLNHTMVSRPIPAVLPDERLIFGAHWAKFDNADK